MKTKDDIVKDWLVRYTKRPLDSFAPYILLTNFNNYVELFARQFGVEVTGRDGNMPNASASGMTIINFGIGSPNAALIMDLLSAIKPKAALFLGKCGGLKDKNHVGDYILPSAAIRGRIMYSTCWVEVMYSVHTLACAPRMYLACSSLRPSVGLKLYTCSTGR